MRNLHRFRLDFSLILDAFSAYFGSQRASKINTNSGRGLERPLEASGEPLGNLWEAFGSPGSGIWPKWGPKVAQTFYPGGMRGDPLSVEISTEFDKPIQSRFAPPKGGGGSSLGPPRIPPGRQASTSWPRFERNCVCGGPYQKTYCGANLQLSHERVRFSIVCCQTLGLEALGTHSYRIIAYIPHPAILHFAHGVRNGRATRAVAPITCFRRSACWRLRKWASSSIQAYLTPPTPQFFMLVLGTYAFQAFHELGFER